MKLGLVGCDVLETFEDGWGWIGMCGWVEDGRGWAGIVQRQIEASFSMAF